jgi:hypothetical protein
MTPKYSIVIGTLDRAPQQNYLSMMLSNLSRAGLWDSPVPFSVDIVDSGSAHPHSYLEEQTKLSLPAQAIVTFHTMPSIPRDVQVPQFAVKDKRDGRLRRSRNANGVECLRVGAATGAPWVLFIEDDVDFCADFLGSVDRWLTRHARRDRPMYSFATPYKMVCQAWESGQTSWNFPVKGFYGNQALAFTNRDARSAADFIEQRMKTWDTGQGFDLLLKEWATHAKRAEFFLSSVPSFVQHIGKESSLHLGRFHEVSGFAGTEWSYQTQMSEAADV